MRIAWLLGWAVPEAWFAPLARAAFPAAEQVFMEAAPTTAACLRQTGPFDYVAGYSLGAHLLLGLAPRIAIPGRVALLAPFFSFPREETLGGRIARAQVDRLARRLRRDPQAALEDFYARAALDVPASLAPCDRLAALQWGLEQLSSARVDPPLPPGWRAWCGANDALLDAAQLHALDARIKIVPGATHHPAALMRAMAVDLAAFDEP